MKNKIFYCILLVFLIVDTRYSFKEYYTQVLDGDIAANLVPAHDVQPILDDPLGIQAIRDNNTYANPNRFFCHWMLKGYLTHVPLFLQQFVNPIDSVYLACAIAKTGTQLILIMLLAMAITGTINMLRLDFMIAAALVCPFFQTNGLRNTLGIVDCSITYTFFYAIPSIFLIIYFLPLLKQYYFGQHTSKRLLMYIIWIPLAFIVCLGGPLSPGAILVLSLLFAYYYIAKQYNETGTLNMMATIKNVPGDIWFYLVPVVVLSLYSLFLGSYNSLTIQSEISLAERYARLPQGMFNQYINNAAYPFIWGLIIINSILLYYKYNAAEGKRILTMFKWVGVFCIGYILLLPLGGYREYRFYILRYDTVMPVTFALLFLLGVSTLFLIKSLNFSVKLWYLPLLAVVLMKFTRADVSYYKVNECERNALTEIAHATTPVVVLTTDCSVAGWNKLNTPEESVLNSKLFVIWGITKTPVLYYHQQQ